MIKTATPIQAWHAPAGLRPGSARCGWPGQGTGDQQRPGCNAPAPAQGRAGTSVAGLGRPSRGSGGASPGRARRGLSSVAWAGEAGTGTARSGPAGLALAGPGRAMPGGAGHGFIGVDNGFRGEAWLGLAGQCSPRQGEERRGGAGRCGAGSGMVPAWLVGAGQGTTGRLAVTEVRDLSAHAWQCGARYGKHGIGWDRLAMARTGESVQGAAWCGEAMRGMARLGEVSGRLAEIGVRLLDAHARGLARYGLAWRASAGCGKPGQGGVRPGLAGHGMAWQGLPCGQKVWTSFPWPGRARPGGAWSGEARRGSARRGKDRTGLAGKGKGRHSSVSGATPERPTQHLWAGQGIGSCWVRHGSVGRGISLQGRARQGTTPLRTDAVTVYFQPKSDKAQWRAVYERIASMSVGQVVTHDELAGVLPDAAEASVKGAFYRAVTECEIEMHRTFASVRGVGYRMVEAREHERLAQDHHRRARRQLKRSKRKATSADRSQLTREERIRLDAIELNLARQMEMTSRLESRVKSESRERKAADADLSERVDKLTALLERHGILKADAT